MGIIDHPYLDREYDVQGMSFHSVGLAFSAEKHPQGHVIETIYDGQGASRGGQLARGDVVTHVDGADTAVWSPGTLRHALQGVAGTMVEIKVLKAGKEGATSTTLVKRGSSQFWQTGEERDSLKRKLEERALELKQVTTKARDQQRTMSTEIAALKQENARLQEKQDKEATGNGRIKLQLDDSKSEIQKMKGLCSSAEASFQSAVKEKGELQRVVDESVDQVRQLQRKMEELTAAKVKTAERETSTNLKLLEALEKIKALEKNIEEQQQMIQRLSASSSSSGDDPRVSDLLLKLQGQETIAESIKAKFVDMENQLSEARDTASKATIEKSALQTAELRLNGDLQNSQTEVEKLRKMLEKAQVDAAQALLSKDEAQAQARNAKDAAQTLQTKLTSTQKAMIEAETACKEAGQQLKSTTQQLSTSTSRLQDTTARLEEAQTALVRQQNIASAAKADLDTMSASHQVLLDLQSQHEKVRSEKHTLQASVNGVLGERDDALKKAEHCEAYEQQLKDEMNKVIEQNEELLNKANTMELILTEKFSADLRNSMEETWKIGQERDRIEMQLQRFLALPDPVGIGVRLGEILPAQRSALKFMDHEHRDEKWRQIRITGISSGLAADLSGVVHVGDIVLEVNGISTEKLNLDQIKERVAGPRGSRVSIRFQRFQNEHVTIDHDGQINIMRTAGEEEGKAVVFVATFKRGAWGPEHCLVSPEETDTLDHGQWTHEMDVGANFLSYRNDDGLKQSLTASRPASASSFKLPLSPPVAKPS